MESSSETEPIGEKGEGQAEGMGEEEKTKGKRA